MPMRIFTTTILLATATAIPAHARLNTLFTEADGPGGSTNYVRFYNPIINEHGDVTFEALLTGTGIDNFNDTAIYTQRASGTFIEIAREENDVYGGTAGSLGLFPDLRNSATRFNDARDVAFTVYGIRDTPPGAGGLGGVFVYDYPTKGGTPTPTQRLRGGQPAPAGMTGDYVDFAGLAMNESGHLAMTVLLNGAGVNDSNNSGIILDRITAVEKVAQENDPAPDGNGVYSNFTVSSISPNAPAINRNQTVAFYTRYRSTSGGTSDDAALVTHTFFDPRADRIRESHTAPDGNGTIASIELIDLSEGNAVLHPYEDQIAAALTYTGTDQPTADQSGVQINHIGGNQLIARTPYSLPGDELTISKFNAVHGIAEGGKTLTHATIEGTDDYYSTWGIYIVSPTGIREVARDGTPSPNGRGPFSSVFGFDEPMSFSENGIALFRADAGGEDGLFLGDGIELVTVAHGVFPSTANPGEITAIRTNPEINSGGRKQVNKNGQVTFDAIVEGAGEQLFLFTPDLHWRNTNPTGAWDDNDNWTLGIKPADHVHDVIIDPDAPVNIAGPNADANPTALTVGGGLGMATLSIESFTITVDPSPLAVNHNGHLRASNAATLTANNANLGNTPAAPTDAPATLTLTGPGTTLNSNDQFMVANNAPATINIADNATANIGILTLGHSHHGTINVTNAATASFYDDFATLGKNPTAVGTLNIDGEGSHVLINSESTIGDDGNAHINITNRATMDTDDLTFARGPSSITSLTVQGPGSSLDAGGITFATNGQATADILDGATLLANSTRLATGSSSSAHINIAGHATNFNTNFLCIAASGNAHLNITHGATTTSSTSTLIADNDTASGNLTVTGPGSTYTTGTLIAGFDGHATILIQQAATLNADNTDAAQFTGSTANITATDPGSAININGTLNLGEFGGTATLNVLNHAALHASDTITLKTGNAIKVDGGTLTAHRISGIGTVNFNAGTINITNPIDFVIGAHQFDPNLTLTDNHAFNAPDADLSTDTNMNLNLDGGTLTADTFYSFSPLTLTRGTINATTEVVNADDLLLGSTTAAKIQTPHLINADTIRGTGRIIGDLTNNPFARINLTNQPLLIEGTLNNNASASRALIIGNGTLQATTINNNADMAFSGPTNILGDVQNNPTGVIVSSGFGPLTFFDDVTNNGQIRTNTSGFTVFLGTTSGSGAYTGLGTVVYEADFTPGSSPGINSFAGNLTFGPFATLELEAQATTTAPVAGIDHDQLTIANTLTLDGTLNVTPLPTAGPIESTPLGNEYLAITYGTRTPNSFFNEITGTLINTAFALAPLLNESTNQFILRATIPGDLNLDNKVSVADLAEFALNFNTSPGLHNETENQSSWLYGDFNTDGTITVADLSLLALNFGFDATDPSSTPTPLSLTEAATLAGIDPASIPEPSTTALIFLLTCCGFGQRSIRTKYNSLPTTIGE